MTPGAIMMTCAILLHPVPQEPKYHNSSFRINKRTEDNCRITAGKINARTGKNVCFCTKPGVYVKTLPSLKDK